MQLDLSRVPFSRRETHFAISRSFDERLGPIGSLCLRFIHGGKSLSLYRFECVENGEARAIEAEATPWKLRLRTSAGEAEILLPDTDQIRIRTNGMSLQMRALPSAWGVLAPARDGCWRSIQGECKLLFIPLTGTMRGHANWRPAQGRRHRHHSSEDALIHLEPETEILIRGYESEPEVMAAEESFDEAEARVRSDFEAWLAACPPAPEGHEAIRIEGAYIGWSSVVPASGLLPCPTMLMSKNWMLSTWNWDNYFNAWASAYRDPAFAWPQFLLYFERQHPTGALGDGITQKDIGWAYTKPPVHGWILSRLRALLPELNAEKLRPIYEPLRRWTEWWFTYRDDDGDGICQYHHGNDSGWDDASAFDVGTPTETPDLTALLILQMEELANLAEILGNPGDAGTWRSRSEKLLETFLAHSWRDGQFVSLESGSHRMSGQGDSLLNFIPILLGARLPRDIFSSLVEGLFTEGRFLTQWGLATEAVNSPEFIQTGYWRGAIWPPPMTMIIDGLAEGGAREQACDLARRYANLIRLYGFGENHDALTGEAHYDPAYTWTVSVYQILVSEYLFNSPDSRNHE